MTINASDILGFLENILPDFLLSFVYFVVDFVIFLITLPTFVSNFFPGPFNNIINVFMYGTIAILLYRFFFNKK